MLTTNVSIVFLGLYKFNKKSFDFTILLENETSTDSFRRILTNFQELIETQITHQSIVKR